MIEQIIEILSNKHHIQETAFIEHFCHDVDVIILQSPPKEEANSHILYGYQELIATYRSEEVNALIPQETFQWFDIKRTSTNGAKDLIAVDHIRNHVNFFLYYLLNNKGKGADLKMCDIYMQNSLQL